MRGWSLASSVIIFQNSINFVMWRCIRNKTYIVLNEHSTRYQKMKNSILLILSVISCFVLSNCKKDCLGYKDYEVKFFTNHKDYSVIESTFETVTEHHLKVATHRQGAVLETVIEQVLHKSAHTQKTILDSQEVHIVLNAETNTLDNIQCYRTKRR